MDVLKKIKCTSLMETLVATILIVTIFLVASLILNNTFSNLLKSNTDTINNCIYELEYKYLNNKLKLPYKMKYNSWLVTIHNDKNLGVVKIVANNKAKTKQILKTLSDY